MMDKYEYDAQYVQNHYDAYGDQEWSRLVSNPEEEVKLHVHTHYLRQHIKPGDAVLEIGAGAGRFTQVLAGIGAAVTVADISPVQLELNRQHALEHGFEAAVAKRIQLDMCDMHVLADEFDAVVCYGGPLSYVFDHAGEALAEIRRVLRPGGVALFSVMSLWGAVHKMLNGILTIPVEMNAGIIRSGDLTPQTYPPGKHFCRMYRAADLRRLLETHGLAVLEMSASNCVSTHWNDRLAEIRNTPVHWNHLLALELEACREPGGVDMGTHTIAITRRAR